MRDAERGRVALPRVSLGRRRRYRREIEVSGRGPSLAILLLLVLGSSAVAAHRPEARAGGWCDRYASPIGSDSDSGSESRPFRTVSKLVASLTSGQTGCLRDGTYASDQFVIRTPRIRLIAYPGEHATLRGRLRFNSTADGAVVRGLALDGRNPSSWLGPLIYANGVTLRGNEITNYNTAICVHVDRYPGRRRPRKVRIVQNRIHNCGRIPATNRHHGVYIANARKTIVRDNWIYDNADRGVQLYPNADGSYVTGNVIDGNGEGVAFGGSNSSSSDDNVVEGNVIANSTIRYNVEDHWQGRTGTGNVVRGNCVWTSGSAYRGSPDGSGIEPGASGFRARRNLVSEPDYADPAARNLDPGSSSPCLSGARRAR